MGGHERLELDQVHHSVAVGVGERKHPPQLPQTARNFQQLTAKSEPIAVCHFAASLCCLHNFSRRADIFSAA